MLVVIDPLAFIPGRVSWSEVNSVTMANVLTPIPMIARAIGPYASANTNAHTVLIYFSDVVASIVFNICKVLVVSIVR